MRAIPISVGVSAWLIASSALPLATAAPADHAPRTVVVETDPDPLPARAATPLAVDAGPRIIYLRRDGGAYGPGYNDAVQNTSSLLDQLTSVPGWGASDAEWAEMVACVTDMFAPFQVDIVQDDPSPAVHVEAVLSTVPAVISRPSDVAGLAPFARDCSILERAIVFIFADNIASVQEVCEVTAQEIAHAYGLEHEYYSADPMSYLPHSGPKTFQDFDAPCGEWQEETCSCGSPTQNSVQRLTDRLGKRDFAPPTLALLYPADGAQVAPGFAISIEAEDDVAVDRVEISIDGALPLVDKQAPWHAITSADLTEGPHEIHVRAIDGAGRSVELTATVDVQPGAGPGGCASHGGATGGTLALVLVTLLSRRRDRRGDAA